MLWAGGYKLETPPPLVTKEGINRYSATGVRKHTSRTAFYPATVTTPAMCMRLTGVGSQYLIASKDADGNHLDGGKTYRVTSPSRTFRRRASGRSPSTTTRRGRCSRRRSASRGPEASHPRPRRPPHDDGTTTIVVGPERPADSQRATGSRPTRQGLVHALRLYSPLESFFDKSWRPSEIEPVD